MSAADEGLFFDNFFGDVEFFHVFPCYEAGLSIEGSGALVDDGNDWHENPLNNHPETVFLLLAFGALGEDFE